MTNVGKIIAVCALIILGLFGVLIINNNVVKPKPAAQNSTLSLSPASPTPTPVIINSMANQTTPSSQTEITTAIIKTSKGDVEISFYSSDAPNTVKNFIKLAQQGFYNGVIFHRVIKGFMIQGGDPTGTGSGGPGYEFPDEPVTKAYVKGTVAMANSGPNTNGSQFFILKKDTSLQPNYTIFGEVISGQEVVDQLAIGDVMQKVVIQNLQ